LEYFFNKRYEIGMWELKNDLLFNKIPLEQQQEFIDLAWNIGSTTAVRYCREYHTDIPTEFVAKLGLTLIELEQVASIPQIRICSEYYSNPKRIVLYKNTIEEEIEKLKAKGIMEFDKYLKIRELFIAHELYHHIECHDIGVTSQKGRIVICKIGPFRITSGVKALSEIGAHGFTKTLLHLEAD
jgi:hypothetical protein